MSLILDALKRAERERKLEKAPDLSAIYQEGPPERRRPHLWFWAGGVFVAVFVAAAILFWAKAPGDFKGASQKPSLTAPASGAKPKAPSGPLEVPGKSVKRAASPSPAAPPALPSPKKSPKPPIAAPGFEKPMPVPREMVKPVTVQIIPEKVSEPPSAPAPPPREEIVDQQLPQEPAEQPTRITRKGPAADDVKATPSAQPKEALPLFEDLPEEVQSVSGPLEINVHMYSSNPPERRVFINMQGYREGDVIGESGFKLVEITSMGVVIDTGKGKALLGVKRK